jgi:hypothetical protein
MDTKDTCCDTPEVSGDAAVVYFYQKPAKRDQAPVALDAAEPPPEATA